MEAVNDVFLFFDTQVITYIFGGCIVFLALWVFWLDRRMRRLLKGKSAQSLEDTINTIIKEQEEIAGFRTELEQYLDLVERRLRKSIQGVETIRFNPFKGTGSGGNQSFATAFLNESGDGVVFSSLYARDRVSVFAKPVHTFASSFDLTDEEVQAIKDAKAQLNTRA